MIALLFVLGAFIGSGTMMIVDLSKDNKDLQETNKELKMQLDKYKENETIRS